MSVDVLIGADGVKSTIRAQIAGAGRASYTGDAAWRLIVPAARLPRNLMGKVMSVWGASRHAVCYYLRGGSLLNFVGLVETDEVFEESWTAKHPWETLKADFDGWHNDIRSNSFGSIVPFTAGTGPDLLERILGEELRQRWNETAIVENKPGASGNHRHAGSGAR